MDEPEGKVHHSKLKLIQCERKKDDYSILGSAVIPNLSDLKNCPPVHISMTQPLNLSSRGRMVSSYNNEFE